MVRSRKIDRHGRIERPTRRPEGEPAEPIIDRDLTYYQKGSRWSFSGGKILLDGYDVNELISGEETALSTYLGIASGLDEYRKKMIREAQRHDQFSHFHATIEALLGKVMGRLKRVYDQKQSGLSWALENGQLILNGINVRSFLALYRIKKSEKAKKFLEGLMSKLVLLLDNPAHEKIRSLVQDLLDEIKNELSPTPPCSDRTLPPGDPVLH